MHGREAKESGKFFGVGHLHHPTRAQEREGRADNLIMKSLLVVRLPTLLSPRRKWAEGKETRERGDYIGQFGLVVNVQLCVHSSTLAL